MSLENNAELTNRNTVREYCKPLVLDDFTLRKIKGIFLNEVELGLCKATNHKAAVKCWITHIQHLPKGCETGKFLALDLGGTNFRVLCIYLQEQSKIRFDSKAHEIPKKLLNGSGTDLFDYVAGCLAKFMKSIGVEADEKLLLGFTFSFPVKQTRLDNGELVAWTKGFSCSGVVGKDVVKMLREAMVRQGVTNVAIAALLNDTTGTLVSCAWKNQNSKIGLIVGTGTNCCYLEKVKNVNTYEPGPNNTAPTMVINCESGAFGDNGTLEFIRTKYDKEIDVTSRNPNCQLFEKMIAGMYLGELARKLMLDCCKKGALFRGYKSTQLCTAGTFKTKYISKVEEDNQESYDNTRTILEKIGYNNPSASDCRNVRYICESVSRRSAHLVSTTLSCLIERIGDPFVVIGIDGSVCRYHPNYRNLLVQKIKCLTRSDHKFDIMLSEDGSGRGAALMAAAVNQIKNKKFERVKSLNGINKSGQRSWMLSKTKFLFNLIRKLRRNG